MSVKLDWQIESERAVQHATEDPETKWRRRRQRLALLLFTLGIIGIVGAIIGAIALRISSVDNRIRQDLVDSAQAEISTLRIGDLPGFLGIMRSQSTAWMSEQSARFKRYQDLKQQGAIKFTNTVVDAVVDNSRGRVIIEEQINNQPYHAIWFFWHYTDGWHHVPSDMTFWGDTEQSTGKALTVKYESVDHDVAQALVSRADRWWTEGCAAIGCASGDAPAVTIQIEADPTLQPGWDTTQPNMLRIPSPLSIGERALADPALSPNVEEAVAVHFAQRLFDLASGQLHTNPVSDAAWLRQSTIDWLVAFMLGRGDTAHIAFIQTVKDHYGAAGLAAVIKQLSTNSDIGVVAKALNQTLDTLDVDWRPFFQWRLDLEKTLISSGSQTEFMNLWDLTTADSAQRARARWANSGQASLRVQAVAVGKDAAKILNASVQTQNEKGGGVVVTFRLIDGIWKRFA